LNHTQPSTLGEGLDQLAGDPQDRGLLGRRVAGHQRPAVHRQNLEKVLQGRAQERRFLLDELWIHRPEGLQVVAPGASRRFSPAILDRRPETGVHENSPVHRLGQPAEQAGQGLRGALRPGRNHEVVPTGQPATELDRRACPFGCEQVAITVRVSDEIDAFRHASHWTRSGTFCAGPPVRPREPRLMTPRCCLAYSCRRNLPNSHLADLLREGGHLISMVGAADAEALAARSMTGVNVLTQATIDKLERLAGFVESGKLKRPEIRTFRLEEAGSALAEIEGRHVRGRLVECRLDDGLPSWVNTKRAGSRPTSCPTEYWESTLDQCFRILMLSQR
jgi:hypothetical protein